ncbi:MAG: NAD/NADP octopine/nopaline dehydrogenase family protein [Tetrasphaera sp.]
MRVTILGSGNGASAAAFDWASHDHHVAMWDFPEFDTNIAAIAASGSLRCTGKLEGSAPIAYAGHDLAVALDGAELALLVGPAYATAAMGAALRPHLRPDLAVVALPGSCGGAFVLKEALGLDVRAERHLIGETQTLPYGTRLLEPGLVRITTRVRDGLLVAALPRARTEELRAKLLPVWPGFEAADSVLQTTLQNGNPVIHPAIMLLNACRIENTAGDFFFYTDGVTTASARLIEAVDKERAAVGAALGITIVPDPVMGLRQGYMGDATYLSGYNQGVGFATSRAPATLDFRYLVEDVGYGLVFLSELARRLQVPTPSVDAIIQLASVVLDRDFRAEAARTPDSLGFGDFTPEELRAL